MPEVKGEYGTKKNEEEEEEEEDEEELGRVNKSRHFGEQEV